MFFGVERMRTSIEDAKFERGDKMKAWQKGVYNVHLLVIIFIILTLIVNPEKIYIVGLFVLLFFLPLLFIRPWKRLTSEAKILSRSIISIILGVIIIQLIKLILILSNTNIETYFHWSILYIFVIIIYLKLSNHYLSKALEKGGLILRLIEK
jgi:phosphatidylserine synthase